MSRMTAKFGAQAIGRFKLPSADMRVTEGGSSLREEVGVKF